jgi:hypothetical protein
MPHVRFPRLPISGASGFATRSLEAQASQIAEKKVSLNAPALFGDRVGDRALEPPCGTIPKHPVEKGLFKSYVVPSLFTLEPFVSQYFISLRDKLLIKQRTFDLLTALAVRKGIRTGGDDRIAGAVSRSGTGGCSVTGGGVHRRVVLPRNQAQSA